MRDLARRAFLKWGGGAAVAAPFVAQAATNELMSAEKGRALQVALSGGCQPAPGYPAALPDELQALYTTQQKRQEQAQRVMAYRDGAFDPSIAALRSVSPATRVRMQHAKDAEWLSENQTIFDKIRALQEKLNPMASIGVAAQSTASRLFR